jgi:hypothetical protein
VSTAVLALAVLGAWPPPAPPSEEGDTATQTEPEPPAPEPEPEPPKLDARGNPVLDYADEPPDPTAELEYADETPPPPELEYAEETPLPEPVEYGEGFEHAPPSKEVLEAQGPGGLAKTTRGRGANESPQRFAFELKFGPYTPSADRTYTGDGLGPYAQIYGPTDSTGTATGEPKPRLFSAIAFDWQFVYLGGPLSVGTSVGFFRDTAQAILAEPDPDADTIRSPADKTSFNVIPVTLLAGYRFELMADRWKVPLVPYAKGGLAYGFWWSTSGSGKVSENSEGVKGRGGNIGWQVNAGMMLRLDFIDRGSARELDRVTGINHTYLFGEYQISRMSAFGSGTRFDVGDDTWLVGLAMEF